jgi:hypothetical protein
MIQASRQPSAPAGSSNPTPRIVTLVSVKPTAVWTDRADPAVPGGASSDTADENCAESATTDTPHTRATRTTIGTGAPNRIPATTADVPEVASAAIVVVVRPTRSAIAPATADPTPPAATTAKAVREATAASSIPASAKLAIRKIGIHVHIAKSSHMCPK